MKAMFAYMSAGSFGGLINALATFALLYSGGGIDDGRRDAAIAAAILGCAIACIGVSQGRSIKRRRRSHGLSR